MVRTLEELETEETRLETLIAKKQNEIFKIEEKINKIRNLQSKQRIAAQRQYKAKVIRCIEGLTTVQILDTKETLSYWKRTEPGQYVQINEEFLNLMRECKANGR